MGGPVVDWLVHWPLSAEVQHWIPLRSSCVEFCKFNRACVFFFSNDFKNPLLISKFGKSYQSTFLNIIIGQVIANNFTWVVPHLTGRWDVSQPSFCYGYTRRREITRSKLAGSNNYSMCNICNELTLSFKEILEVVCDSILLAHLMKKLMISLQSVDSEALWCAYFKMNSRLSLHFINSPQDGIENFKKNTPSQTGDLYNKTHYLRVSCNKQN